ncbi:MAG: dTDP-4-dehydrorhamnose 3,5-epimerase [Balneolaceae bacterium]
MKWQPTDIEGVSILEPSVHRDSRGYFFESFRQEDLRMRGLDIDFVQDNCSQSVRGTVRGLHYQIGTAAQAKLVLVVRGVILDVAVDLRKSSPSFGSYVQAELSEENHRLLFVPEGFAHGFSVLSEDAVVCYKCSHSYDPDLERGVRWNDPVLGIDWGVPDPLLSEKDRAQPLFKELLPEDLF